MNTDLRIVADRPLIISNELTKRYFLKKNTNMRRISNRQIMDSSETLPKHNFLKINKQRSFNGN